MNLSKQWKTLTRDQKAVWKTWARNNPVTLDNGALRRVSAHKAMTLVVQRRTIAGEAANITTAPASTFWLSNALSVRDTGPFNENAGSMCFRVDAQTLPASKWFVWATAPVLGDDTKPLASLAFIKSLSVAPSEYDDLTASILPEYQGVHGSIDGPGENGEWDPDRFVWFVLRQYYQGQLGPRVVLKGQIAVEL